MERLWWVARSLKQIPHSNSNSNSNSVLLCVSIHATIKMTLLAMGTVKRKENKKESSPCMPWKKVRYTCCIRYCKHNNLIVWIKSQVYTLFHNNFHSPKLTSSSRDRHGVKQSVCLCVQAAWHSLSRLRLRLRLRLREGLFYTLCVYTCGCVCLSLSLSRTRTRSRSR